MTAKPTPVTTNNTPFTDDEVRSFPYLGFTINRWRGREVTLWQHPTEPESVVSIGKKWYDGDAILTVIAVEPKSAWRTALDYAAHDKTFVSE